jgi:hypothetical protein
MWHHLADSALSAVTGFATVEKACRRLPRSRDRRSCSRGREPYGFLPDDAPPTRHRSRGGEVAIISAAFGFESARAARRPTGRGQSSSVVLRTRLWLCSGGEPSWTQELPAAPSTSDLSKSLWLGGTHSISLPGLRPTAELGSIFACWILVAVCPNPQGELPSLGVCRDTILCAHER